MFFEKPYSREHWGKFEEWKNHFRLWNWSFLSDIKRFVMDGGSVGSNFDMTIRFARVVTIIINTSVHWTRSMKIINLRFNQGLNRLLITYLQGKGHCHRTFMRTSGFTGLFFRLFDFLFAMEKQAAYCSRQLQEYWLFMNCLAEDYLLTVITYNLFM